MATSPARAPSCRATPVPSEAIEDHIGRVGGRGEPVRPARAALERRAHPPLRHRRHGRMAAHQRRRCAPRPCAARSTTAGCEPARPVLSRHRHHPGRLPGARPRRGGARRARRGPLETASFQSVCGASLMAAKAAWLSVRAGEHDVAAACAGRVLLALVPARLLRGHRPGRRQGAAAAGGGLPALHPVGRRRRGGDRAAAARRTGLSLKVRWIDLVSLADRFDPCMWAGAPLERRSDVAGPVVARRVRPAPMRRAPSPWCRTSSC